MSLAHQRSLKACISTQIAQAGGTSRTKICSTHIKQLLGFKLLQSLVASDCMGLSLPWKQEVSELHHIPLLTICEFRRQFCELQYVDLNKNFTEQVDVLCSMHVTSIV
jgi:hypothetical protein